MSGVVVPGSALPAGVLRELTGIVGPGAVVTEPGRLLSYETDALARHTCTPAAVVLPADSAQAARVVETLTRAGVPITPRGAGTGLSGGSVVSPGGVLLGTARMNRILSLDPVRRLARVQAGVINTDLSAAARPHGLYYPPDPSSQTACTLGGNVGENAGGPHCLKYGVTTRYVTGLTLVTGTGQVLEVGGADRVQGQDLTGLIVGSEGRLGLVTEVEVRLLPRARYIKTMLAVFESTRAAGAAVSAIIAGGLLPAAMEIMDRATIEAVEASVFAAGYPKGAGAVLVVEFDGSVDTLDGESELAATLCREAGATQVRVARDDAERQALWQGRKKAYGAFGRITPDLMVQDATVPRSVLPEVLEAIEEVGRRHGLRLANVFHAGDGNLHPKILYDRRDPELVERVEAASSEIMKICVEAGGTITGEHGVGLDKRAYMPLVHGPGELDLMRRVQAVFDPEGVWNPGKVLPEDSGSDRPPVAAGRSPGVHAAEVAPDEIDHRCADLTVRVAGGIRVGALQEVLAREGQWLAVDGPGVEDLSVEDVILGGLEGLVAPALGSIRDHLLGLELATPGGRQLRLGGQVMKNVAGFDLVRCVVGSHGRLGGVTSATLRLLPLPALSRTLTWRFPADAAHHPEDPASLAAAVRILATSPVLPTAAAVLFGSGAPALMVRLSGSETTVEAEGTELRAALGKSGAGAPVVEDSRPGSGRWVEEDSLGAAVRSAWQTAGGESARSMAPRDQGLDAGLALARQMADVAGTSLWLPLWNRVLVPVAAGDEPTAPEGDSRAAGPEEGAVRELRRQLERAFRPAMEPA